jgi:hypothetical protein
VDAPLGLGVRNALHAMATRFEFQFRVHAEADDLGDDFLVPTHFALALRNQFDLPALTLGITEIHPEQIAGEQRGFVATGAGPYFQKDIPLVVGILRQQLSLQFVLEVEEPLFAFLHFRVDQLAHLGIADHGQRRGNILFTLDVGVVQLDRRRDLRMLARELAVIFHVPGHVLAGQQGVEFLQPGGKPRQLGGNGRLHSGSLISNTRARAATN